MIDLKEKAVAGRKEKRETERHSSVSKDESCRCKETSEMKPGDLLRLMISDLAFWRRPKK